MTLHMIETCHLLQSCHICHSHSVQSYNTKKNIKDSEIDNMTTTCWSYRKYIDFRLG